MVHVEGGEKRAGGDGIDQNAVVGPFHGQSPGELGDGPFAGCVGGAVGRPHQPEGGGNVDDPPPSGFSEVGGGGLAHRPRSGHIDRNGTFKVGPADLVDGAAHDDARVVDQNIDSAQLVYGSGDHPGHILIDAYVARRGDDFPAGGFPHAPGGIGQVLRVAAHQGHRRPRPGKGFGHRLPQSLRSAGYQSDPPPQLKHFQRIVHPAFR